MGRYEYIIITKRIITRLVVTGGIVVSMASLNEHEQNEKLLIINKKIMK